MNNKQIIELRGKILKGIELSFKKLVLAKHENNGKIVCSKGGEIIIIKASEFVK
jgi:hypothetical protein